MKRFTQIKTFQLFIYIVFTLLGLWTIFFHNEIFQGIKNNTNLILLCFLLWLAYGLSFVFIYLDFRFLSSYKTDYSELNQAVHTDSIAGIANRYSCDAIIEKYADQPLPQNIASLMFDLSNIQQINNEFGHAAGNRAIRDFSAIIKMAAFNYCFVGRNGGNKFLALFEDAKKENIQAFLDKLETKVTEYNATSQLQIEYKYGMAFEEDDSIQTINQLIALSNRRIYEESK